MSDVAVREIEPADLGWVRALVSRSFGSPEVVSRGRLHRADALPGWVATLKGTPAALLSFETRGGDFEVVVLVSEVEGRGLATTLLDTAVGEARARGCRRLWLVTTNDNTPAIAFYQRRGLSVAALHAGAVDEARRLKPSIPETGLGGVPIRDEIELELTLG